MKHYTVVLKSNIEESFFVTSANNALHISKELSDIKPMTLSWANETIEQITYLIASPSREMYIKQSGQYRGYSFDVMLYKTATIVEVEFTLK